jgi:hypothetical protein
METQDNTTPYFSLNVRFITGHTIKVHQTTENKSLESTTTAEFKQLILRSCMHSREPQIRKEAQEKQHIRLIFQGKLMQDPMFLSFYHVNDGDFIHCTFSDTPIRTRPQNNVNRQEIDPNGPPPPRGFDRLTEAGFDQEDVLFIRNQFYASRPHLLTQFQQGRVTGDDLRELEEEWMNEDNLGGMQQVTNEPSNDAIMYYEGTNYHMYGGILLGFFLGFVMLLLVRLSFQNFTK